MKTICNDEKYVDDSTLWESCNRSGSDSNMQTAADQADEWTNKNNMELNTDKTKGMSIYFGHKANQNDWKWNSMCIVSYTSWHHEKWHHHME